jgi:hypothetical protein
MTKSHTYIRGIMAAGLYLMVLTCPAAFASYAVPPDNISSGVIQAIDYANNSIIVNGHTYKISPKAAYVSETVSNIGGLQNGMRIQFIENGPVTDAASQITNIVVLPPT